MTNVFGSPEKVGMKKFLFSAGISALESSGWAVERVQGSGKSSVRRITKGSTTKVVSIKTTQDTWIAFQRTDDDKGWGTLDDVDALVAVSVDNKENPKFAQVHMLDGDEMRERFNRHYAARMKAGHIIPNDRGVWVSLYHSDENNPVNRVGAGAGLKTPPFATVPLDPGAVGVAEPPVAAATPTERNAEADAPLTIADAKRRLAITFGVDPSSIKITVEA
jgi:hypothetical protein